MQRSSKENSVVLPRHIAIIMDGNGRWAKQRFLPRTAGHKAGVEAVRRVVKACVEKKIEIITLWAFGSENWKRPKQEVNYLMELFMASLSQEIKKLHKQNVQVRIIGDRSQLTENMLQHIAQAEKLTAENTGLKFVVAFNYGGYWDITTACKQIASEVQRGVLTVDAVTPELIRQRLTLKDLPDPDLFIRSSGEQRLSNFMLWHLAYSELYFTDVLWPDFGEAELDKALAFFASRERRFGCISEQLEEVEQHA